MMFLIIPVERNVFSIQLTIVFTGGARLIRQSSGNASPISRVESEHDREARGGDGRRAG